MIRLLTNIDSLQTINILCCNSHMLQVSGLAGTMTGYIRVIVK